VKVLLLWVGLGELGALLLAGACWLWLDRLTQRLWDAAGIGRQRDVWGVPAGGQVPARHRRHLRLTGLRAVCGAVCILALLALFATGLVALLLWRDGRL
jgi:hypothetical protein